jgi:hypothetical protein
VFGAYIAGREWFFGVEWALAALSGVMLGAAEAVSVNDPCAAAMWGTGGAVGLCLWMKVLLGGLKLLSNVLSLVSEPGNAGVVVTVSVFVELAVAVGAPLVAVCCGVAHTVCSDISVPEIIFLHCG